jgi:hypothetical protein
VDVAIYFEGGGNSAESKAILRQGMTAFLKPLAELVQRRSRWKVVSCGSRDEAFADFSNALEKEPGTFNVLLVDSEAAVAALPRAHLRQRDPSWNLDAAPEDQVHLMAQCMEAWLVADPKALADYYKQGFNANALPDRINLEEEPKTKIYAALEAATRQTQKGCYGKIKHASDLLKRVSPDKVRNRCSHCDRFFKTVKEKIGQ